SATADRVCAGCPSGSYSEAENQASCVAWTDCEPGSHVTDAPSATTDRSCAPCAEGSFSAGANATECVPSEACAPGTLQTSAATPSAPAVCDSCAPRTWCAGGSSEAGPCAAGTWDHDGVPATACAPKPQCVAGQYVSSEGSATVDRSCEICEAGTFSAGSN